MSCKLEPAIWPRDTGQRILCFNRCQLITVLMSDIKKVHSKPNLYVSFNLCWSMAAMLRDSVPAAVVVVVRTRPRAIPLAMITMRKSTHGFPFLSHDEYGAPLGGPSGRRSFAINALVRDVKHVLSFSTLRSPTTFSRFPKIFQNCSEGQTNVSEHFPKVTVDCRRFPKTTENDPKMFTRQQV